MKPACIFLMILGFTTLSAGQTSPPAAQSSQDRPVVSAPVPGSGDAAFREDVDRFLEGEFRLHPERATQAGDHRFDGLLTDFSAEGLAARIRHATMWRERFKLLDAKTLTPPVAADREWLISYLDGVLLRAEEIHTEGRQPGLYLPTSALYGLIKRDFAPAAERMKFATARQIAALANLDAARQNLTAEATPKVAIDITLQQMNGSASFVEKDLPAAFASVPDGPEKEAFRDANLRLLAAIAAYRQWLEKDLGPRATERYSIGAAAYQKMLEADDMVDLPVSTLEEIGEKELSRLLALFAETAKKIDASHTPEEVAESLARQHPSAEELLGTIRSSLEEMRSFVVEHHLATIPSQILPIVHETPPFSRATTFASMDTPGPFEKSTEAYFNVTLPDPSWPSDRKEQLLQFFSPFSISDFAVHEVYPGHYTQFLNNRLNPDKVRSLFFSGSNAEGWALYCEEMMLDQGFHSGDPRYRLAQIQAALQRACRYLVGIRMHTHHLAVDEAAEFFRKNAYLSANNSRVEALRGTEDPGYLRYQLGKLMIMKLRDDVQRKEGAAFDLGRFHDRFLGEGAIPIRLIRRAMLGSTEPLL